jgi:hypothetical protein
LGDKIESFNYKKLEKVKPYQGRKRIVEESDEEDSYNVNEVTSFMFF